MSVRWLKKAAGLFCRACLAACIAGSTAMHAYAGPVKWDALKPASVVPFDDPFKTLTSDQLYKLAMVARLLKLGSKPDDGTASGRELAGLYSQLSEEGVDAEYLLSVREEIARKRRAVSLQVNQGINGQSIEIVGFPLPAVLTDGNRTSFFLVPIAGICAHVSLPLPNQIIRISSTISQAKLDFRKPVKVRGVIRDEQGRRRVLLFDGPASVEHAYGIDNAEVSLVMPDGSPAITEIKGSLPGYQTHPLRRPRATPGNTTSNNKFQP